MLRTNISIQICQMAKTPLKIIEPEQSIMICTTRHGIYQSYKVSMKSDQKFWRISRDKLKVNEPMPLPKNNNVSPA